VLEVCNTSFFIAVVVMEMGVIAAVCYVFSDRRFRGCRAGGRMANIRRHEEQSTQCGDAGDLNRRDVTTAELDSKTTTLVCAPHSFSDADFSSCYSGREILTGPTTAGRYGITQPANANDLHL